MIPTRNRYRERTWTLLQNELMRIGRQRRVLDFGSGDGWFAARMIAERHADELLPIDVKRRTVVEVEPVIYSGDRLPFEDRSFDLCYSVDVVHHCADPPQILKELLRVTRRYLLIKDHTAQGAIDRVILAVLDDLGNRRFGIPSPHHYQNRNEWELIICEDGWRRLHYVHPAYVHRGVLGALTNRLQYVALYERVDRSVTDSTNQ